MVLTGGRDSSGFECDVCGNYEISRSAFAGPLDPERAELTPIQRAALSHRLRTAARGSGPLMITTDWLKHFKSDSSLPSPAVQAINIIRFIGDEVTRSGERVSTFPVDFPAIVGAPNREFAAQLAKELRERGVLNGIDASSNDGTDFIDIGLTLDGWEQYEAEKRGRIAGKYGFIAMKYGDPVLEPFVMDVVKPAVKDGTGYDLIDMRNVARAGIIDNIMRTQIRDAAFVIVDLTHDNSGAYWEAGYAEGLGKPVIYICEKAKFEAAKTHFDTNHCTTVLWSQEDKSNFSQELIATLRRSLNLFPGTA
jgi:hypothetical protein